MEFYKGLQLYTLARSKAKQLGVFNRNADMGTLICAIQEKEGFSPCFKTKEICTEFDCCWQRSCGAEMKDQ